MPRPMTQKTRLSLVLTSLVALFALVAAGCGSSGSTSSSDNPVSLAPTGTTVLVDGVIRPQGDLKSNVESLAKNAAGISDPGTLIVDRLDQALANDPESKGFTYEKDIAPWLGEDAAIALGGFDGQNFNTVAFIVQTKDSGAAQDFIDRAAAQSKPPAKDGSYQGVDYKITDPDGTSVGMVGDFLVVGSTEKAFHQVVDAQGGDSLQGSTDYQDATSKSPSDALANVYVDIGGLIKQAGSTVDPQVLDFYKALGYDFSNATAFASVIPGSDQVEVDASTNAVPNTPTGDVKELLGSFPAGSFFAAAAPDFGSQLQQAIDGIDKMGFPPDVPPGQLKSTLQRAGVNLDKIASSIGNVGLFVQGTSMKTLGGALVLEVTDEKTATDTVQNLGDLLKRSNASGFTPVTGNAAGFAFRTPQLPQPLVVLAAGKRVAIGYGVPSTQQAVSASGGQTLDSNSTFQSAADALGSTPLSGFLDAKPILALAESLGATSDPSFEQARPYLDKLDFLAFGTGHEGDTVTQKIILKLK
jgi:hypothetical protein